MRVEEEEDVKKEEEEEDKEHAVGNENQRVKKIHLKRRRWRKRRIWKGRRMLAPFTDYLTPTAICSREEVAPITTGALASHQASG